MSEKEEIIIILSDDEEEDDEDEEECYGRHCPETSKTTQLKLEFGWNKWFDKPNGAMFSQHLYCDYCEKLECYDKCQGCFDTYKLTDMKYVCDERISCERTVLVCKSCIDDCNEYYNNMD